MSNILKDNGDLLVFNDILKKMYGMNLSRDFILNEFGVFLPLVDGSDIIKLDVRDKGFYRPMFIPSNRSIIMCINKTDEWLDKNINDFVNHYKINDYKLFRCYLFLFSIFHEIEHSYQFLMGEGLVSSSCCVLSSAYKGLFDLLNPPFYILPRLITETRQKLSLILYKINENFYLLERNANIESSDLICKLATLNNDEDIFKVFYDIRELFTFCGYDKNNRGCIENTYRNILMYDKYRKFYNDTVLSCEDKIRYGFAIDDDMRKMLKKI